MIEIFFILFIVIGFLSLYLQKINKFPPGPVGAPYVGYYPFIDQTHPTASFDYLHKKYGRLVGVVMINIRAVVVNGYEAVKEAMMNESCIGRPDVCLVRDRFQGERLGVVFREGEPWKLHRRFLLHNFRNLGFAKGPHETIVMQECKELVDVFLESGGKPISVEDSFSVSAVNVLWALIGGTRYSHKDAVLSKLTKDIKDTMHGIQIIGSIAVVLPFIRYLFPNFTGYSSVTRSAKAVSTFTERVIEEHKMTRDPENPRDFIDIFLNEMESVTPLPPQQMSGKTIFTEKELRGLLLDMLTAGTDTMSSTMSFSILLMVMYPEIQSRVQEELDSVFDSSAWPTVQDKPRLVYTEACLSETMRYRYIAPTVMPHKAVCDTHLMGYSIPKDTVLMLNVRSVFMDKDYWGDPDVFRPERFISEDGTLKKIERFIPFGKGKRKCPGEALARMFTLIAFATLLHRFTFRLPPGETLKDTEGMHGLTLAPPEFHVVAIPRYPKAAMFA